LGPCTKADFDLQNNGCHGAQRSNFVSINWPDRCFSNGWLGNNENNYQASIFVRSILCHQYVCVFTFKSRFSHPAHWFPHVFFLDVCWASGHWNWQLIKPEFVISPSSTNYRMRDGNWMKELCTGELWVYQICHLILE
jgi:hypothetical protein